MSGEMYEVGVAALLFLRCLQRTDAFSLACNHSLAGAFDDLVLVTQRGCRQEALFVQLKHKKQPLLKRSSLLQLKKKDGFSLPLYCKSHRAVLDALGRLAAETGLSVDAGAVTLVLFTNAEVEVRHSAPPSEELLLLATGGWEASFDAERDADVFGLLGDVDQYRRLLEAADAIGPASCQGLSEELRRKLVRLRAAEDHEAELRRLQDEARQLGDVSLHRDFLRRLRLLCGQVNHEGVPRLVKAELRQLLRTSDADTDANYRYLMERVRDWWRSDRSYYLTHDAVIFRDLCRVSAGAINNSKVLYNFSLRLSFDADATGRVLRELEGARRVAVLSAGRHTQLTVLKLCQALPEYSYLVVTIFSLIKRVDEVASLWRTKWYRSLVVEVPQRLKAEKFQGLVARLLEVLQTNQQKLLVLVLSDECHDLADSLDSAWLKTKDVNGLSDLDRESQGRIVDVDINFQGHLLKLRDILEKYPTVTDIIDDEQMLTLTQNNCGLVVGSALEPVVEYYIPRCLSRRCFVRNDFFQSVTMNTVCAVSGTTILRFGTFLEESKGKESREPADSSDHEAAFVVMDGDHPEEHFEGLCGKYASSDVHWLHYCGASEGWKWRRTRGSLALVSRFLDDKRTFHWVSSLADVEDRVVPIIGVPGMGKSTLVSEVARAGKKAAPECWFVRINLGQYTAWVDRSDLDRREDCFELLEVAAGVTEGVPLARRLLWHGLEVAGNVAVLLDGFDEISPTYTAKGAQLVRVLASCPGVRRLWVTSRPVTRDAVEAATAVVPFTLESFGEDDQKRFFSKYWKSAVESEDELEALVGKALQLINKCLDAKLSEVPLHAVMIAEAFTDGGKVVLPGAVDIIDLYARFIEKKIYSATVERGSIDITRPDNQIMVELARHSYEQKHMVLALKTLLTAEDLASLAVADEDLRRADLVEKSGIVYAFIYGRPQFVHKTFAEYFAALWLSRNYCGNRDFLLRLYSVGGLELVRDMLDRILDRLGVGGRTPLITAAIRDDAVEVEALVARDRNLLGAADDVLGWTPLRYAEALDCWAAAERLLLAGASSADLPRLRNDAKDVDRCKELLNAFAAAGHKQLLKALVRAGASLELPLDAGGSTALHVAAFHGRLELVEYLHARRRSSLRRLVGVLRREAPSRAITTPLHRASQAGRVAVVRFFLKSSQPADALDRSGRSPLHLACGGGSVDVVRVLLEAGADVDRKDNAGRSPLLWASGMGHKAVVELLVQRGATLDASAASGETPLHWAAMEGDELLVRCFLDAGAAVDARDKDAQTPLHKAAYFGRWRVAQALLDAGADVDAVDTYGSDALVMAARQPHDNVVKVLVEAGVDVNKVYGDGATTLLKHAIHGRVASIKCLIAVGADVERRDASGRTAMHWVVKNRRTGALQSLIEGGADVNARDAVGDTPLHLAAQTNDYYLIVLLLDARPDVDARNAARETPLHWAAGERFVHLAVEELLGAGADPAAQDRRLRTPLHWAARVGNLGAARLLALAADDLTVADDEGLTAEEAAADHEEVARLLADIRRRGKGAFTANPFKRAVGKKFGD